MNTADVANRLVELCKQSKYFDAMEELYADGIVSVEPDPTAAVAAETHGKAAVIQKSADWVATVEIHAGSIEGPFLINDRFAVVFAFDYTRKASGQRVQLREVGLYTLAGGKIVREEFLIPGGVPR